MPTYLAHEPGGLLASVVHSVADPDLVQLTQRVRDTYLQETTLNHLTCLIMLM